MNYAQRAVDELLTAVEQLAANVMPGTAQPYRTPTLTPEQREEADRRARQERLERVNIAPGDSPDPYRLEVVDLLTDILTWADALNDQVDIALWLPVGVEGPERQQNVSAHSQMADPRPYLYRLRGLLPAVEDTFSDHVEVKARELVARAAGMLGLISDGQHLPHECPWCGVDKLRVRTLKVHDGPRPHVVCESDRCAPSTEQVGHWHRGRPAWDLLTEGEWLARCIEAVDAARVCRCGEPLPLANTGRPRRYCSSECKQQARQERELSQSDERMAS